VKVLELDAREWRSADDAFDALLEALGAPDWHGHDLDALNDSLQGGDLNAINPPLTIYVTNLEGASAMARVTAWRMRHLCVELAKNGIALAWSSFVDERTDDAVAALEEFRGAALQKEQRINAGDASQDAALHATMADRLRQLFELGAAGLDCIEALLHDERPEVASWIAAELAARGDHRGASVLQTLAGLAGSVGFSARMTLNELRKGQLRSPFGLSKRI
jgi:RNAse (barnase) inhibitor barstar